MAFRPEEGEDAVMEFATLRNMPSGPERRRALGHTVAAGRRLQPEPPLRGRAWINGREVGGADARYKHLGRSHD